MGRETVRAEEIPGKNTSKDGKVQGECPSAVIDGKPGRVEVSSVTDTFIFIHDCDGSKRY